jgi:hypothetical protein
MYRIAKLTMRDGTVLKILPIVNAPTPDVGAEIDVVIKVRVDVVTKERPKTLKDIEVASESVDHVACREVEE